MQLDTPCIGICSTVYGDTICRGCKRSFQEVIVWNSLNDAQKDSIFVKLNLWISEVAADKIKILDSALIRATLEKFNIRYRQDQSALCWAFYILRDGRHKINSLEEAGFTAIGSYKNYNFGQLYQEIDLALFKHAHTTFNNNIT
jgi:uncharacterized protein